MELPQQYTRTEEMANGMATQSAADEIDLADTVAEFLDFMSGIRNSSELTVRAYAGDIRHFLRWCKSNRVATCAALLTRGLLFRYLTSLNHLSPNTIRRRVHAIGSWFRYLIDCGKVSHNPARGLPLPRRERKLPKYPTMEQARELLAAANTPREGAVIHLLLTAGLRRAELIGLDLDDLRSDGSELRVLGKGYRPRTLPLPHLTQEVLAHYLEVRGRQPGPLLLNRCANRMGATSLRRIFQRLARRAGLEDRGFSLHSMRHSYATMLLRAGTDLATVRDLLGHSDVGVTSLYLHSDPQTKRAAVERLPVLEVGGGEDE